MTVWYITGERISTGERGSIGIVRCDTEDEATAHALAGLQGNPDIRVVSIELRRRPVREAVAVGRQPLTAP
jgi:hypothetical protein